jgi:hypothetical protein
MPLLPCGIGVQDKQTFLVIPSPLVLLQMRSNLSVFLICQVGGAFGERGRVFRCNSSRRVRPSGTGRPRLECQYLQAEVIVLRSIFKSIAISSRSCPLSARSLTCSATLDASLAALPFWFVRPAALSQIQRTTCSRSWSQSFDSAQRVGQ